MKTFLEYVNESKTENVQENFTANGKKYTVVFGKYYCDGQKITKDEYYAAKPVCSDEALERAIETIGSDYPELNDLSVDLLYNDIDADEFVEIFKDEIESNDCPEYEMTAALINAEDELEDDDPAWEYISDKIDQIHKALEEYKEKRKNKRKYYYDPDDHHASYYHAKYGDPL